MDHLFSMLFINSVDALSVSESLDKCHPRFSCVKSNPVHYCRESKMCVWDPSIVKANNGEKEPFYKLGEGHTKCASRLHRETLIAHTLIRTY